MEKLKRRLAVLGIFIMIASPFCVKPKYQSRYELLHDGDAFAKCSCGTVYIGNKSFLRNIPLEEGVILVEDERFSKKDPNVRIYNSCSICTNEDRNDVLEILQEYEKQHPSNWDRTIESMRLEWLMHNLSYDFSYQPGRTETVDLNNGDETKYDNKILQRIFGVG